MLPVRHVPPEADPLLLQLLPELGLQDPVRGQDGLAQEGGPRQGAVRRRGLGADEAVKEEGEND